MSICIPPLTFSVRSLRKTVIESISLISHKTRKGTAATLLAAAVTLWFVGEAYAPQQVQAYTARADLAIDRLPEENYETLVRRAEAAARAAAQRSFDQDILITNVSVIVSVQNYGAIAPVLVLNVSRPQWRTRPDPQRWATYFKTARELLFFGQTTTGASSQPPAAAPAPSPQPPAAPPAPSPEPTNVQPPVPVPVPPPLKR